MTSATPTDSASARGYRLARQVFSYGVIGVISALLDTTVFWLLTSRTSVPPQAANALGICCGISLSFALNRVFTFSMRDRTPARFATFFAVGLGGLASSALILGVGMRMGVPLMQVKLFSVLFVAAMQFILNRTVTFRAR